MSSISKMDAATQKTHQQDLLICVWNPRVTRPILGVGTRIFFLGSTGYPKLIITYSTRKYWLWTNNGWLVHSPHLLAALETNTELLQTFHHKGMNIRIWPLHQIKRVRAFHRRVIIHWRWLVQYALTLPPRRQLQESYLRSRISPSTVSLQVNGKCNRD